jgi:virginiamycin A acetyltransferase
LSLRGFFKSLLSAVSICIVAPLGLSERAARRLLHRDIWFQSHGEFLSLLPGKFGRYLRNAYYWMTLQSCPLDCCFIFGSSFTQSGTVVGHRVYLGAYSMVGLATIGDDTVLGDHVHLLSGKHQHSFEDPHRRIQDQPQTFTRIYVGRDCWLGTNTVAMEDIGNNCVIGASSVVTRAIPDNMIAAGNPARVLGPRPNANNTSANLSQEKEDNVECSRHR